MEFTSSDSEIISETEYEASEHELDDTEGDNMRNQENLEQENTQKAFKRERKRRKHHCIYCYLNVSNYSRHLERNHSDELQVQEIFCLNKKSKKRKKLLDRLRREGDFISTEIVPVLKIENKQTTDYIACKFCKGYYSKKCLRRHVKKCFFNPDPSKPIKSQIEGQNIMIGAFGPNDPLKISGLLDKLRADKISLTAKRDKIICEVARRYLKSHKEKHLVTVAKRYMRRLARILEQVRQYEGNSKLSLEEILKPSQFKNLIQATKSVSGYETESDTYKSPSFALQTGTLLKRAIQAALSIEIQRDNPSDEKRTDLNNLIHLIETDWAYEISTQAVQNLAINRFNKPTLIPLTKDIKGKRLEEIELDENTDNVIEDNDSDDEMKIDELKESNKINQINNIEENEPANIDEIRCPKKSKREI
ncbi:hypothetical protein RN001_002984 [Aquatica leii]|uniref:Uncharacterized protein n=1 Tax=Aquatica leii TaxID=1421715 RepID=A0AAN7QNU1_9COLE|nr:hypothetical protein RN001_002984 [Aquatica leii]